MAKNIIQDMIDSSPFCGDNSSYIESLFETYLTDPQKVDMPWRLYFQKLTQDHAANNQADVSHATIREKFRLLGSQKPSIPLSQPAHANSSTYDEKKQILIQQLITAYRIRGHQKAQLDPLKILKRPAIKDLNIKYYGLSHQDLDRVFHANPFDASQKISLKNLIHLLENTYCQTIGAEFMHITDSQECQWFYKKLEKTRGIFNFSPEEKLNILTQLNAAEGLEKYLAAKYPGTKRFGLEGGESLIPMMHSLIYYASLSFNVKEIVIGMAHRGRLNMLVNILGKTPSDLFEEFEGKKKSEYGSGDVKYHQGFSSDLQIGNNHVHLALAFNPSHLEIVSPVVQGSVRSRQFKQKDNQRAAVLPISIHGDAAFAGQGVVMETFQMSQTRAYTTGGSIHIIINNQIGFTTSRPDDARSTEYATDVAKMIQAPILHVNADDPEAVVYAIRFAIDYRMTFKKDIVVDLYCYRRLGHNEADEPSATQPLMYQQIKKQKTTRSLYAEKLINEGLLSESEDKNLSKKFRSSLEEGKTVISNLIHNLPNAQHEEWLPYVRSVPTKKYDTGFDLNQLKDLGKQLCQLPEQFTVQRQVKKLLDDRYKMAIDEIPVNWGMAENLAYATLLSEETMVRLTGQDVGRGTFSHRHAVLHDQKNGSTYTSLAHLKTKQKTKIEIYDSFLSEEAVLAFEYGYATTTPKTLVIWEAQFGDFANGAQVVIDQFITSGEIKWGRLCGLVMLLPHGYEGQGPEHSSARLERYLQLCAQHNIQICLPTTPAQIFHVLRRQIIRPLRKPLIVFSPKSLLRHKLVTSTMEELAHGSFKTVIDEIDSMDTKKIKRIVLCSGKVYYDLLEARRQYKKNQCALLRIEQLYPFPKKALADFLKKYSAVQEILWCQEEPMNQGAWYCSQHNIQSALENNPNTKQIILQYVGRNASAAPACGYMSIHVQEQTALINKALDIK